MIKHDPRDKNIWFNTSSASKYFQEYREALNQSLSRINENDLVSACELMHSTSKKQGQILVAGNGGSAAIAEHLSCDWAKGAWGEQLKLRVVPLASHLSLMTAIGNDFGYEEVFSRQVEIYGKPEDLLVVISSSGNSPNILKAIASARSLNMKVLSLTGFDGGKAKSLADANLHVPFNNYAIVEDAHQALMQSLVQFLYRSLHS